MFRKQVMKVESPKRTNTPKFLCVMHIDDTEKSLKTKNCFGPESGCCYILSSIQVLALRL